MGFVHSGMQHNSKTINTSRIITTINSNVQLRFTFQLPQPVHEWT